MDEFDEEINIEDDGDQLRGDRLQERVPNDDGIDGDEDDLYGDLKSSSEAFALGGTQGYTSSYAEGSSFGGSEGPKSAGGGEAAPFGAVGEGSGKQGDGTANKTPGQDEVEDEEEEDEDEDDNDIQIIISKPGTSSYQRPMASRIARHTWRRSVLDTETKDAGDGSASSKDEKSGKVGEDSGSSSAKAAGKGVATEKTGNGDEPAATDQKEGDVETDDAKQGEAKKIMYNGVDVSNIANLPDGPLPGVGRHFFTIEPHRMKTAFDLDIDQMETKPWLEEGNDPSDFFNFEMDEESWREYSKEQITLRYKVFYELWRQNSEKGKDGSQNLNQNHHSSQQNPEHRSDAKRGNGDQTGGGRANVCYAFINGECSRGDMCRWSHSKEAIAEYERQKQNKRVCYKFQRGTCPFGDRCRFLHVMEGEQGEHQISPQGHPDAPAHPADSRMGRRPPSDRPPAEMHPRYHGPPGGQRFGGHPPRGFGPGHGPGPGPGPGPGHRPGPGLGPGPGHGPGPGFHGRGGPPGGYRRREDSRPRGGYRERDGRQRRQRSRSPRGSRRRR